MRFPLPIVPLALLGVIVPKATAQVALDRPPNLGGTWVPDRGVVRFDFLHRFYVGPGPTRNVFNAPTFTFALGLPADLAIGTRYSTRSESNSNNELELYAKWRRSWGPVVLALTPAYNGAAESLDGELSVDWTRGRITLSGAARGMSQAFGEDRARAALAGGAVWRLNDYVAIGGDFASLLNADPGEDPAWSTGLLFVIPGSPHTFSLHASNVGVNTIQGSSRRGFHSRSFGKPLYGFEFTIPLHLKRFAPWFKGGRSQPPAPESGIAVEVRMDGFKFREDSITVSPGQTVRWTNLDPLEHTVTFERGATSSEPLARNGTFVVRFDRPGVYVYQCTPHPYMKGVVVVR